MVLFKTIIQGRIEFGTQKAYDMAVKMFTSRSEKYYKNDILFLVEEIFFPETLHLEIPRVVKQVFAKSFKNTIALLEYIVQFGLSGEIDMWQLEDGKIRLFKHLEPNSDKVAVQQYNKGKLLVEEDGKEDEAIQALTKAIEKYDRHAQAYERRGKVNLKLKKYHDALRDFNKCLALDVSNPYAYFGKALVLTHNGEIEEAIESFQSTIKKSVAHQTIHWKARRLKGKLHFNLKQYDKAEFELKLFAKRQFASDNTNFGWKREGHYFYGRLLMEVERYKEALEQFEFALDRDKGYGKIKSAELLRLRGLAKKESGDKGFMEDIKTAAEQGDKKAADLLAALA